MEHRVKIYSLSTCSHCKATKKFLKDIGIDFKSTDVDLLQGPEKENILREIVKYNPQRSFPTVVIGNKVIVGFREADIRQALGI
jgi:glutaredoxin-like protein NrdH